MNTIKTTREPTRAKLSINEVCEEFRNLCVLKDARFETLEEFEDSLREFCEASAQRKHTHCDRGFISTASLRLQHYFSQFTPTGEMSRHTNLNILRFRV